MSDPELEGAPAPWLNELLACPFCRGALVSGSEDSLSHGEGGFECLSCEARFPVVAGVPRLTRESACRVARNDQEKDRKTLAVRKAFEHQWRAFGSNPRIFGKTREEMRELVTGSRIGPWIDENYYRDRLVLDAGCGHGRYVQEFAEMGARVVGLDMGEGHLVAARKGLPSHLKDQVAWIQGDLLHCPLQLDQFDLVFCDGVIHHTRDPRLAFARLAGLVVQGGSLYVWVYPRGGRLWEATHRSLRAVTTRLPPRVLEKLCYVLAPLLAIVPTYSSTRPSRASFSECAQVVYDWLSPAYQSHHTEDEVESWYREEGLLKVARLPVAVGMIGRKEE